MQTVHFKIVIKKSKEICKAEGPAQPLLVPWARFKILYKLINKDYFRAKFIILI